MVSLSLSNSLGLTLGLVQLSQSILMLLLFTPPITISQRIHLQIPARTAGLMPTIPLRSGSIILATLLLWYSPQDLTKTLVMKHGVFATSVLRLQDTQSPRIVLT